MHFDVLKYPVVFSTPGRLTDVTAWHGLIPVAFALTALHRPSVFVELGTHKGDSYCAFCQAVAALALPTRCYAVDTWEGDPHAGFYDASVYEDLRAYHDPRYGRFSTLLRMTFDQALSHFDDGEIDLLHIDGLHSYEAVKHDFETWLPKMSRQGVVLFHDIAVREKDFGVWRLWEEIARRYPTCRFGFSHGLGIAAVGEAALDGDLGAWFRAGEGWERIHALFAALGDRWMKQDRIRVLETELEGRRRELAEATRRMDEEHERWRRWSEEKAAEIGRLQAALEEQRARAEQLQAVEGQLRERDSRLQAVEAQLQAVKAQLRERDSQLRETNARLQKREAVLDFARRQMEIVRESWLWRALGRPLFPDVVSEPPLSFFPTMTLERTSPVQLPEGIWSGAGKDWGGMRRFLVPMEAVGCQVVRQGSVLQVQAGGGRLVVRLDGPAKDVKLVFRIAGETPLEFFVEFGVLEGNVWRPLLRDRVQVIPGTPTVLHRHLPAAADAMAFEFPSPGEVPLAQIAVIAISPLERILGPVASRLRRPSGKPAAGNDQPQPAASDVAEPSARLVQPAESSSADPYAYMAGEREASLVGRRVAVLASSEGNDFMAEIAATVAGAAEELGAEVMRGDEHSLPDLAGFDWVIVTAPHEFFTLGAGKRWPAVLESYRDRLLLFNTEQPQTAWFQAAAPFFPLARAVLDIHYQTAVHLRRQGFPAYFVPLGPLSRSGTPQALPSHPAFEHLAPAVRERLPDDYGARPFDVVFVGTASPRRQAFFARHARFFAGLDTFLYLPEGNAPFKDGQSRTLDFTALSGLVRRAKIVLNVHRDEQPYLEWQRMVNLGILQETLVISEHCDFCPALRANGDYIDLPLTLIPDVCSHYLAHPEEAERFAARACERLRRELPMTRVLGRLLAALEEAS